MYVTLAVEPRFRVATLNFNYRCHRMSHARKRGYIGKVISFPKGCIQWRNVISGGPRFKLFEGPASRSAKGTSRAPYMHEFSSGSRACSPGKLSLNLESLKCHFLDFGERFYRILMVRKRHCCSIGYSLSLGAPIWPIGVGGPRVLPVQDHSSNATGCISEIIGLLHQSEFRIKL
jgi:hypothetical protein